MTKKARQSEESLFAWAQQRVEFKDKQRQANLIVKAPLKKMDTQLFLVHQSKENTICARLYQSKTTTILEYSILIQKNVYICLQVLRYEVSYFLDT